MQSSRSIGFKARKMRLLINGSHVRPYSTTEASSKVETTPAVKKSSIPKLDSLGGISLDSFAPSTTGFQVGVVDLSVDQFALSGGGSSFAARMLQRQKDFPIPVPRSPSVHRQNADTLPHQLPHMKSTIPHQAIDQAKPAWRPQTRNWQLPGDRAAQTEQNPVRKRPRAEDRTLGANSRDSQDGQQLDRGPHNGQQQNWQQRGEVQRKRTPFGENDRVKRVGAERPARQVWENTKPRAVAKPAAEPANSPTVLKARDTALNAMSIYLISGASTILPSTAVGSTVAAVASEAAKSRKVRTKVSKEALERYAGDYSRLLGPQMLARSRVTDLNAFEHARLTTARVRGLGPAGRERALNIIGKLTGTTATQPHT